MSMSILLDQHGLLGTLQDFAMQEGLWDLYGYNTTPLPWEWGRDQVDNGNIWHSLNRDYIDSFADSRGNPTTPPYVEEPGAFESLLDIIAGWIERGDGNGIMVPGLPFPIPGGAIQDIIDGIQSGGQTVGEAIEDVLGTPGGTTNGTNPQGDPVGDAEEEGGLVLGQPIGWEGGSIPSPPSAVVEDERDRSPPLVPGLMPGETGGTPNPSILEQIAGGVGLGLGLLPLISPNDPPRPESFELWNVHHTPDQTWGIELPDYGTPDYMEPYQFQQQPSQPMQVGYNTEPRRPFLTVPEQEARRRMRG